MKVRTRLKRFNRRTRVVTIRLKRDTLKILEELAGKYHLNMEGMIHFALLDYRNAFLPPLKKGDE